MNERPDSARRALGCSRFVPSKAKYAAWILVGWLRNERGVAGLAGAGAIWALSATALGFAMRANLAAEERARLHSFGGAGLAIRHLHGAAVLWTLGFTVLQLLSFLTFAFVLRACFRLRTAICFSVGAGLVMVGDVLGLLGVLVWVGTTLGAE